MHHLRIICLSKSACPHTFWTSTLLWAMRPEQHSLSPAEALDDSRHNPALDSQGGSSSSALQYTAPAGAETQLESRASTLSSASSVSTAGSLKDISFPDYLAQLGRRGLLQEAMSFPGWQVCSSLIPGGWGG